MNHSILRGGIVSVAIVGLTISLVAASKPKSASTSDAIQELLQSETQTANSSIDRRESLQAASRPQNELQIVGWQAGYVQNGKLWLPFEQSVADSQSAAKLDEYQIMRSRLSDQPHGHWQMAVWCRKNGLHDQERAHLLQALDDKNPAVDPETVYERLGCQKVGNEWVSPQARRNTAAMQAEMEDSYKHWHSKFESLLQ